MSFNRVRSLTQPCFLLLFSLFTLLEAAEKPNVLFIAIDDLRPELGCYGSDIAISPNIDQLSANGVRFDSAHCQLAVCNPSRVSLLTGLRPDSAKVWTLDVRFRHTIPDALTLPRHFKDNGYYTVGYGKIFHNPWPDNISWSEPHSWPKNSKLWSDTAKQELKEFKAGLRSEGTPQAKIERLRARATEVVDIPDHEHIDGAIAMQAIDAMKRAAKQDKPFFLAAGFVRPHLPFVVPGKYWDLYDRKKIPLAANPRLPENAPPYAMNTMYELRDYFDYLNTPDPRDGPLTEAQQRELKHGYLASVSFIDAQVGILLEELKKLGLAENTIVILWSDHGWKLGEHNSWCKQTNYEIDTRVPLIIYDPRAKGNGRATDSLVELVDVYPTLCDLAGIEIPKSLEGASLKPILENPDTTVKKAAVSQFLRRQKNRELMGYAYRTNRWRYVEWIDRKSGETVARELFDHSVDSTESVSLAANPEHKSLMNRLGKELRAMLPQPLAVPRDFAKTQSKTAPRPGIAFQNESGKTLTVFWLPEDGEPREIGEVEPGRLLTQRTAMGHRFQIQGPGIDRTVTVTKAKETVLIGGSGRKQAAPDAPNIVVIMGDDWSWPHASILGDKTVKTPHFDRIAREGVLFENAFVSAPSCTPSRFAVASGQYHWRLGEGVNLGGSLAGDVPVYPDLLSDFGYRTGFCRKGAEPSRHAYRGTDPFGRRFKDFAEFLDPKKSDQPFCFWYGAGEPHRPYEWQASLESDLDLSSIEVPPYLPDNDTTRTDLGDYYLKVQKLDLLAGEILRRLETAGELENTIIVMTGDNGMPFPRAKATLFDSGTRVPLAIRWGAGVKGGRQISDFVNLTDLAPTLLEAAGLPVPEVMTGKSLLPILTSETSGQVERDRTHVLTGMERHVYPHPSRAIRTENFLYIRNFSPEDWPTGIPKGAPPVFDFKKTPWPTMAGAFSHNVDPGPTKQWMRFNESPQNAQSFDRKPVEELYDLRNDPDQLTNLLDIGEVPDAVEKHRKTLATQLANELRASGDPRYAEPNHTTFKVSGWTIHLHDQLVADSSRATNRMLELLHGQLQRVVDVIPEPALTHLREIPIWINPPYEGKRGTAEYHPDVGWLKKNDRNPAMGRAIEITNVSNFPFENRRMPYVLLHELAHGFHDRILQNGYANSEIRTAYERARDSGSYDEVARFTGIKTIKDKAYGMSNPMEYFAESTEAYFGRNDFFPFTRPELKQHDPWMHDLVQKLWTLNSAAPSPAGTRKEEPKP
jgi:arylsulfatase A-like enzyme